VDVIGRVLVSTYGRLQSNAAAAVDISSGAAWRAALKAAAEVGTAQVVLGDRPAEVSQRLLARGMAAEVLVRATGAVAALGAGVAAAVGSLPLTVSQEVSEALGSAGWPGSAAALGTAAAAALLWPVVAPLVEVWRFGQLDGDGVEAAVALTEPIQTNIDTPLRVWGEDALLRWPGAQQHLIEERDTYMARVVAAAAVGGRTGAPAFVAGDVEGRGLMQYMMSAGGPGGAAPAGLGDGEYAGLEGARAVVAVVGSAHVRGMCRQWGAVVEEVKVKGGADLEGLLTVE